MPEISDTLDLQAFSYCDRHGLLPTLTTCFSDCGGWVLERKSTSATTVEFRFEIQLHGIVELYSSLAATGVEMTRTTHDTLTALCMSRHHIRQTYGKSRVLSLRLELNFLEDVTLHSLLMTGSGEA